MNAIVKSQQDPQQERMQDRQAAAPRGALADGVFSDPFAQYLGTPVPVYQDGAEYERDEMLDGRDAVAD